MPNFPATNGNLDRVRILDVGCGINKFPGSIGIDRIAGTRADVLCELDHFPYPFRDSQFDQVRAIHVIEHVTDVIRTMEEFHRLTKPGGRIVLSTPHYTDFSSFCDPTHRWHLNSFSFRYFGADNAGYGFYSPVRMREISVRVKLLAFWRWLGFELLVNCFPRFRRFWEYYLCYIVRGKGSEESFQSSAHGAGRRMSRTQAQKSFTPQDLMAQTSGVVCRKDRGVIDEIPGAYKSIDEVMENQRDLVETVHTLKQVVCVKG